MRTLESCGPGLLAILIMALATIMLRVGGFWMMAHVPLTPHVRRMLEALPGSIVAAIIVPVIARSGPEAIVAMSAAVAIMVVRRNELLAIALAVLIAAVARSAGM